MRILDKFILREMIGPFLNSVMMFLAVLVGMGYLFKMTELLVQGVPLLAVAKLTLYGLPDLITLSLPMSMLLGSLLAFGRLSGDHEHIALFAGGISFYRAVRPVVWMGLAVSVIAFVWNEAVVPPAQRAYAELMQTAAKQISSPTQSIKFTKLAPDKSVDRFVNIRAYDPKTGRFLGVTMLVMSQDSARKGEPELLLYADWAIALRPDGDDWEFHNLTVKRVNPDPSGKNLFDSFMEQTTTRTAPVQGLSLGRSPENIVRSGAFDAKRLSFLELRDYIARLRMEGDPETLGAEVDLWGKLTFPLACLIFGILGAPLGIRPHRSGKTIGFGIAIAIIFTYWVLYRWLYIVGQGGGLPPIVAAFTPCMIGLLAAAVLVARTRQ